MSEPVTVEDAAIDWALRHARGDMSFADIEAFAAWLGESDAHGVAFDDAMAAWQMLETPRLEPEILPFRCEALKALQSAQRRRWSGFPAWRAAAAAGLVLALAGGLYGWMAPRHYETGIGERRVVALSDGSRLTLDAQTSVDVDYSSHARRLTLDNGRATFTVAKDPLRPFPWPAWAAWWSPPAPNSAWSALVRICAWCCTRAMWRCCARSATGWCPMCWTMARRLTMR
jgi:transmembrane sensor